MKTLIGLGVHYVEEDSKLAGFSVDVSIPDKNVAIEFDGPSHFARNDPLRPLGPTLLKQRLIEGQGVKVVRVTQADWAELETPEDKRAYLSSRLQGLIPVADVPDAELLAELA